MPIRDTPWPAGTPCWADVLATDPDVSKAFYEAVLGWTYAPGNPEFGGYANALVRGETVTGINGMVGDLGCIWTLYFATVDADATCAAITAAGGTVVAPPMAVGELGRLAFFTDPSGAHAGLWEAGTQTGTRLYGEPGSLVWEDLRSTDPAAAQEFYAAVFGFACDEVPMAPGDYRTFAPAAGAPPYGGMGGLMGSEGPSRWTVYFAVADLDDALDAVATHGGTLLAPRTDTPYGPMATVADPAGAELTLMVPTGPTPER